MADPAWTTRTVTDALVRIDGRPLWVRLSAVVSIAPDSATHRPTRTHIGLTSGESVYTSSTVDEVATLLGAAMRAEGGESRG